MDAQFRQKAKSRLRNTVVRYREARRSLHAPASWQSRYGLDEFLIADVQTGFGTFVASYLAHLGWSHSDIGLVLTVGGVAALVGQIPGGALVDAVTRLRRTLVDLDVGFLDDRTPQRHVRLILGRKLCRCRTVRLDPEWLVFLLHLRLCQHCSHVGVDFLDNIRRRFCRRVDAVP